MLSGHSKYQGPAHAEATFENAWTLDLTLAGQAIFAHPEGDLPLEPLELLLVRPNHHKSWFVPATVAEGRTRGPGRWEVIWFIFEVQDHMLAWMQYQDTRSGYIRLRLHSRECARWVANSLRKAHRLTTSHHAGRESLALNALEEALIWCHYDQRESTPHLDPRVEQALRFLHGNLSKPIRIAEVTEACQTSRARLLALFTRQVGVPMMVYLEQERIRRSKQLLAEALLSVKQIAVDVGYSDPRYFAKRFKRAVGLRPTDWRQANKVSRARSADASGS